MSSLWMSWSVLWRELICCMIEPVCWERAVVRAALSALEMGVTSLVVGVLGVLGLGWGMRRLGNPSLDMVAKRGR